MFMTFAACKCEQQECFSKNKNSYNTEQSTSSVAAQSVAVRQTIYYESMKNIWDGVLHDPVMDCCGEWLEINHHLSRPCTIIPGASKNGNMKETDAPKVHCTGIL
jgi:hypothetical protein